MIENQQPYDITGEYDITELLAHFDSNYIFDIINDKLSKIDYSASLSEPNIIASFEENFKIMNQNFPGDAVNIRTVRTSVYLEVIRVLTTRFNLKFNDQDENIDLYSAAYYLYDFLVCNRNNIMTSFFTAFIVNNKDSLYGALNLDDVKKSRDSSSNHARRIFTDYKYGLISANIPKVINYISTLDVSLDNIFQSTYTNPEITVFLSNSFADKGNFFKDFYCSVLKQPEILPIFITNIKLRLQNIVGTISAEERQNLLLINQPKEENNNE